MNVLCRGVKYGVGRGGDSLVVLVLVLVLVLTGAWCCWNWPGTDVTAAVQ